MKPLRKLEYGFSLVSAVFLLVVIAALGAFAVTISSTQHQTSALDINGARAYQAARAGIEWAAHEVILQGAASAFVTNCQAGAINQDIGTLANTLKNFTVKVQCSATSNNEGERNGANPLWVYTITSTATLGTQGTPSYVEREVSATIAK